MIECVCELLHSIGYTLDATRHGRLLMRQFNEVSPAPLAPLIITAVSAFVLNPVMPRRTMTGVADSKTFHGRFSARLLPEHPAEDPGQRGLPREML